MIHNQKFGQFGRSLIIIDDGAGASYIEGCTSPIFLQDSLHVAVVEIIVLKNANFRYTAIQNWSDNIINLVTKRAEVYENANMEWIDGNIGSYINIKYPAYILKGKNAKGIYILIGNATTKKHIQDTGAKMIDLAPNTKSLIISKSIVKNYGKVNYCGNIKINDQAFNSSSHVDCHTLSLDNKSQSNTMSKN